MEESRTDPLDSSEDVQKVFPVTKRDNRFNLETELLESLSVDSIEIHENELEGVDCVSQQVNSLGDGPLKYNNTSPISEKVRGTTASGRMLVKLQQKVLEDLLREVICKYKNDLIQKLHIKSSPYPKSPEAIIVSDNTTNIQAATFELMTIDIAAELTANHVYQAVAKKNDPNSINSLDLDGNANIHTPNTTGIQKPQFGIDDDNSDTSSKYIPSVAAFSAQPLTQQACLLCRRRVSANNFTLPNLSGNLNTNPFSKRHSINPFNGYVTGLKRAMSKQEFFQMLNLNQLGTKS